MIRAALAMWRERSRQLIELTKNVDEEEREKVIEQIEQLLDDRDKLQAHIVQPFTAEEEEAGQEIVRLEKEVQASLARFMKEIRVNIMEAQAKKENMSSYVNPYGNINPDGAYYDTKQ
ncbi:hypothetical protein [Sporosarcina sp.]|uniref:hypothetical protein n=1 Tax=Sporosarcina sp. TaxID=49982 RepID=UPI00260732B0|nr:hypothetical protein [Sporosarcina sp.]